MKLTDMINALERLRDTHGNIPIYREYDGLEYVPQLMVSETKTDFDERQMPFDVPCEKRVLIT